MALLFFAAAAAAATADAYPQRPLRIVVPQAAGSLTDIVTRVIAQELAGRLAQQIIVDTRAGAGGSIGAAIVAKATADGYTLLMANLSTHGINPWLYRDLPYDPVADFAPISMVATGPYVLLVHPGIAAASVKELIGLARSRPGELAYGSGGNGTGTHLAGEMLNLKTGTRFVHVPYKGSAPGLIDLAGGRLAIMFIGLPPAMPQIKVGRVRALAVTAAKRAAAAPELPTMMEAGVADYAADTWLAVLAPARTPQTVIAQLNAALVAMARSQEIRHKLESMGIEAMHSSPAGCAEYIRSEVRKWGQVIKDSGASIN